MLTQVEFAGNIAVRSSLRDKIDKALLPPGIKVLPLALVMPGEPSPAMDSIKYPCWPWKLPVSTGKPFCAVRRRIFENQKGTRITTCAGQFANK